MTEPDFTTIETNGVRLRTVVAGAGPLVILVHGFPECWYSWRHQVAPLASAGYRVAVPDMRGYGGSDCPPAIEDYDIVHLTADVAGIADALGERRYTVVGHDWGALVAWHCAHLQPDRVARVVATSVPHVRFREGEVTRQESFGDRFWYMVYFQQPGVAETELERDLARTVRMVFTSLGGEAPDGLWLGQLAHPATDGVLDCLVDPERLPDWLDQADLDYYARQFARTGFRGGLNWYRNIDRNLRLTPELEGAKIAQPAFFIAGDRDPVLHYRPDFVESMRPAVPDLRGIVLIPGAGHWVPAERPREYNEALLGFLRATDA